MDANKIISRAKAILLSPRTEWPVIGAEPSSIGSLYTGYIVIMAAIPAVIAFLSSTLIGRSVPFLGSYRVGMAAGIQLLVLQYAVNLLAPMILALIVEALAPTFGGQKDRVQALKLTTYAYTASWVAAVIGIVPGLGVIAALAGFVYSIYLLNMGLPFTMKNPPERSVGYTAVTAVVALVVYAILGAIIGGILGLGFGSRGIYGVSSSDGVATGSAAAGLQAWAQRMDAASKQVDSAQKSGNGASQAAAVSTLVGAALGSGGKVESLSPDRLKPFIPDTLDGLKRTQLSVERNAAMGVQISKGSASYSDGAQKTLNLEITDTGSLKGLVGFASGWAGVEEDKETDTGYDKTYKNGDQLIHEQWDSHSLQGQYGVVVGDRFSVAVSGNAGSIDELKAAVAGINLSGLEALKNDGVQSN